MEEEKEQKKCFVCETLGTSLPDKIEKIEKVEYFDHNELSWRKRDEYFHLRCITTVSLHPERFDRELCDRVMDLTREVRYLQKKREKIIELHEPFEKYYNLKE